MNMFVYKKYKTISPIKVVQKDVQTVQLSIFLRLLLILPNNHIIGFLKKITGQSSPFSTIRIANENPNKTERKTCTNNAILQSP
jgi:hypothetical protein